MKVTIKEIAERAGVHRATVDKVLHNRVGVSDEVRMKVQRIIKEMGYTPNPAGRVLQKQGKKYRIEAILVEVDALPFLKAGIEQGVHNQVGFDIEVTYAISKFQDAERQKEFIDNAIAARADGIIISPINSERVRKAIDRAVDSGIPVVATNADIDGTKRTCCVGINNRKAARITFRSVKPNLRTSSIKNIRTSRSSPRWTALRIRRSLTKRQSNCCGITKTCKVSTSPAAAFPKWDGRWRRAGERKISA